MEEQQQMTIPDEIKQQAAAIPRPVAKRYTPDGEVIVMGIQHPDDPKKVLTKDMPLAVVDIPILPSTWTANHDFIMGVLYEAAKQIRQMKGRRLPLKEVELAGFLSQAEKENPVGIEWSMVTRLEKWDFITIKTITVLDEKNPKHAQKITVVYFTPKGRAYIRKSIDPSYGIDAKKEQESEDNIGAAGDRPDQGAGGEVQQ